MTERITALSGTLQRHGRDDWRWRDGTPEPRVEDLSPDEWNFRCRTTGERTYAEVLRGIAQETEALTWVIDRWRAGIYRAGQSGDHTGPLIEEDSGLRRMHIQPGQDPLTGHEPLPESPGPIPAVILVPIEDWDEWVRANPAGAQWLVADEPEILRRAHELGWRPSEPYQVRETRIEYFPDGRVIDWALTDWSESQRATDRRTATEGDG